MKRKAVLHSAAASVHPYFIDILSILIKPNLSKDAENYTLHFLSLTMKVCRNFINFYCYLALKIIYDVTFQSSIEFKYKSP